MMNLKFNIQLYYYMAVSGMCHQLNDFRPNNFVVPKKDDRNYNIIHRALYKNSIKTNYS